MHSFEIDRHSPLWSGCQVSLHLDNGQQLTFTIVKPFEPFTQGQVLLARCPEFSPSTVVLKLFDPRFNGERFSRIHNNKHDRPWTIEAETAAAVDSKPLEWGDCDVLPEELYDPDEPCPSTMENGEAIRRAARWEKVWQERATESLRCECAAYHRLEALQGTAIPRLLGFGRYLPYEPRFIKPSVLVLEYIHGIKFADTPAAALTALS